MYLNWCFRPAQYGDENDRPKRFWFQPHSIWTLDDLGMAGWSSPHIFEGHHVILPLSKALKRLLKCLYGGRCHLISFPMILFYSNDQKSTLTSAQPTFLSKICYFSPGIPPAIIYRVVFLRFFVPSQSVLITEYGTLQTVINYFCILLRLLIPRICITNNPYRYGFILVYEISDSHLNMGSHTFFH